jgi:flagellar hook-basal body complex protein FliE
MRDHIINAHYSAARPRHTVVEGFMKCTCIVAALALALSGSACGSTDANNGVSNSSAHATQRDSKQVTFTEADLDQFERGLRREIDAVKAAQAKAASATTAQERGEAMQAQWETTTIALGAKASGLSEARYRDIRDAVNRVLTTLDFQGRIDGPLSIDLERADAETKARVSGDAFAGVPPEAATALRARMDRLVPVWIEYKKLVAVAG